MAFFAFVNLAISIVDYCIEEITHEAIYFGEVNLEDEDNEYYLLALEVKALAPKYDGEHLSNEDSMSVL